MRRIMLSVVLVLAFFSVYAIVGSAAQETMPEERETLKGSELLGAKVETPQGEALGTITDVVTGPEGLVAFAVLAYLISDDTQLRVAIPVDALSCDGQNCILSASKELLDAAPSFVSENDLSDPRLAEDIYRHFGVQPYWTEEGGEDREAVPELYEP